MSQPTQQPQTIKMAQTNRPIRLAISTCPNDTFAFHAILKQKIDFGDLNFEVQLLDIQQLNDSLFAGQFDFAKASFHAAALLADQTVVLPSGSALGFGVGPLLLAAEQNTSPANWPSGSKKLNDATAVTLCPGQHTTANMLFQMFYSEAIQQQRSVVKHALFSKIMPALQTGTADFGVCIHEGRFTWKQQGLAKVADLGELWEQKTKLPLPLGGILARRDLPRETVAAVQQLVRKSIEYGLANRQETLSTMREHAQELDDTVLFGHVDLYVNQWTVELGTEGARSLAELSRLAKKSGLVAERICLTCKSGNRLRLNESAYDRNPIRSGLTDKTRSRFFELAVLALASVASR